MRFVEDNSGGICGPSLGEKGCVGANLTRAEQDRGIVLDLTHHEDAPPRRQALGERPCAGVVFADPLAGEPRD